MNFTCSFYLFFKNVATLNYMYNQHFTYVSHIMFLLKSSAFSLPVSEYCYTLPLCVSCKMLVGLYKGRKESQWNHCDCSHDFLWLLADTYCFHYTISSVSKIVQKDTSMPLIMGHSWSLLKEPGNYRTIDTLTSDSLKDRTSTIYKVFIKGLKMSKER